MCNNKKSKICPLISIVFKGTQLLSLSLQIYPFFFINHQNNTLSYFHLEIPLFLLAVMVKIISTCIKILLTCFKLNKTTLIYSICYNLN